MKRVFYELDEEQYGIVTNTLDQYCVKYQKRINREEGLFRDNITYDVEIDMDNDKEITLKDGTVTTPYNFIVSKVEERLNLEKCFEMRTREPIREKKVKKQKDKGPQLPPWMDKTCPDFVPKETCKEPEEHHNSLFEDLFQPNLGIDIQHLEKEQKKQKNILDEIEQVIKPKNNDKNIIETLSKLSTNCKDFEDFKKAAEETGLADELKSIIRRRLNNNETDIIEAIDNILNNGEEISFTDLPEDLKKDLTKQFPESLLRSDKCIIKINGTGVSIEINGVEE